MPTDLNTQIWWMDSDNPADPQNINHVVVGAETGEEQETYLIETTGDQMYPYDVVDGFSTDVSPTQ